MYPNVHNKFLSFYQMGSNLVTFIFLSLMPNVQENKKLYTAYSRCNERKRPPVSDEVGGYNEEKVTSGPSPLSK